MYLSHKLIDTTATTQLEEPSCLSSRSRLYTTGPSSVLESDYAPIPLFQYFELVEELGSGAVMFESIIAKG